MEQTLEQIQKEEQVQQLSAMQVAMARILELPLADMEERVRNEMDANEALEEKGSDDGEPDGENEMSDEQQTSEEAPAGEDTALSDEAADYLSADDIPDYLLRQQNAAEEREVQLASGGNSYDDLFRQIGEQNLTEHEQSVLEYIIGSLDDDGYLRKEAWELADEMAIYQMVDTTPEEVERMLSILQTFDPRGIGARNLQECLMLQLEDPDFHSPYKEKALQLLRTCFKDFAAHHWDVVRQKLKIDKDTFDHIATLLTRLNPRPGSALNDTTTASAPTVIPDFYVGIGQDGEPFVTLNNGDVPELRVGRSFRQTLTEYGKHKATLTPRQRDEYVYARKKVNDALLFIEMVHRRHRTLLSVMQTIVALQRDFFVSDDDESLLVPMVLKDVAEKAGVDISTVSRVAAGKYVRTDYGVYPVKFFFSYQFTAESGEELSSRQARTVLKQVVDAEDKRHPLSDQAISEQMKTMGYPISRRTVVKYRDMLGIPTSRLRKEN